MGENELKIISIFQYLKSQTFNLPDLLKSVVKSSQCDTHEKDKRAQHLILKHGPEANIQCKHLPL